MISNFLKLCSLMIITRLEEILESIIDVTQYDYPIITEKYIWSREECDIVDSYLTIRCEK